MEKRETLFWLTEKDWGKELTRVHMFFVRAKKKDRCGRRKFHGPRNDKLLKSQRRGGGEEKALKN